MDRIKIALINVNKVMKRKYMECLLIIISTYWISFLNKSDSYYAPYFFMFVVGLIGFLNRKKFLHERKKHSYESLYFGIVFSLLVLFANYTLWYHIPVPEDTISIFRKIYRFSVPFLLFLGGAYIGFYVIELFLYLIERCQIAEEIRKITDYNKKWFFLIPFFTISIFDSILLFFAKYPGNLTPDSISQINQILSGQYTNHHPYFHTQIIKVLFEVGMTLFNDINAAVATYLFFQIILVAACFSFTIYTLHEMNVQLKYIVLFGMLYLLLPYHIIYSFTMWKDILFSVSMLMLVLSLYRIIHKISQKNIIDICVYVLASFGVCLLRSNGFFIYVFVLLGVIFLYRFKYKKIIIMGIIVCFICFILKHNFLEYMNVKQPDTIEMLSIPTQQICRVIVDHDDLTKGQYDLLSEVIEVDKIKDAYRWHSSDPIKELVREKNNQEFIVDNYKDFINVYINLGSKHFVTYVMAWIDETKGYWNGGYDYWDLSVSIYDNTFGIFPYTRSSELSNTINFYVWLFDEVPILNVVVSIGLYTWFALMFLFIAIKKRTKDIILVSIPIFANILSLLITTPLYAELRYVYSNLCIVPFIVILSFMQREKSNNENV